MSAAGLCQRAIRGALSFLPNKQGGEPRKTNRRCATRLLMVTQRLKVRLSRSDRAGVLAVGAVRRLAVR